MTSPPPPGWPAWAAAPVSPPPPALPDGEVERALVERGLPPEAGLQALITYERLQALRTVHRRLQRLALGSTRGSWSQAASLLHRMVGGDG